MTFYEELELDIDQRVSPSLTLTVFVMLAEGEGETLHQSATYEVRYSQPVLSLLEIYQDCVRVGWIRMIMMASMHRKDLLWAPL